MTKKFEDTVVLIAGAATGIGAATALAFAKEGATLVLTTHKKPADEVAAQCLELGAKAASTVLYDVAEEESSKSLVATIVERYGKLDVAFNNAGILPVTADLVDQTTEDFDWTIAADLRGVFFAMKYEILQMKAQGTGGSIINTSSVAGVIADPGMAPYVAAKHGVIGLSKAAALEVAKDGIRVNAISPGLVETPMTAGWLSQKFFQDWLPTWNSFGRPARPEEIAGIVLYLADPANTFTTGQNFLIDGAQTAH
ncbi:MAG: SDR family oxidoreductase [Bifidobacteriaceae bacterium]|nr:SDR family oxidoreductase [Bifidobacteriaceae bacterium]